MCFEHWNASGHLSFQKSNMVDLKTQWEALRLLDRCLDQDKMLLGCCLQKVSSNVKDTYG